MSNLYLSADTSNLQITALLNMALAATTTSAAPIAQSWQDSVNQALAEANAAISSGSQQAQTSTHSGIESADAAIRSRRPRKVMDIMAARCG